MPCCNDQTRFATQLHSLTEMIRNHEEKITSSREYGCAPLFHGDVFVPDTDLIKVLLIPTTYLSRSYLKFLSSLYKLISDDGCFIRAFSDSNMLNAFSDRYWSSGGRITQGIGGWGFFLGGLRNDDDKGQKSDRLCDVQVVKRKVLEGNNNKTS